MKSRTIVFALVATSCLMVFFSQTSNAQLLRKILQNRFEKRCTMRNCFDECSFRNCYPRRCKIATCTEPFLCDCTVAECVTCQNCESCGCQATYDRAARLWRIDSSCRDNDCPNTTCYCPVPAHVPPMGGVQTLRNISCETPGVLDEWDLLLAFGAPGRTFTAEEGVSLQRPVAERGIDMITPLGLETSRFSVKIQYFSAVQPQSVPFVRNPDIKVRMQSAGFDMTVGFKEDQPLTVTFGHWSLEITYN